MSAWAPTPQRFWPQHLGEPPVPEISLYPRHPKGPVTRLLPVDPELVRIGDHHGSTFTQHAKFLEVVRGRGQVEVTLEDGAKAVRMGLAAQEAARRHSVLTFD